MEEDIYGDLDTLDNQFDLVQKENEDLKTTVQMLEQTTIKFSIEIKELKRINGNLELNISKLFKTAKAEIERKNLQIAELRKELDSMLFKRGTKRKIPEKTGDESKEKQILTEQFERAQKDIDQKNRIIHSLNIELKNVRREVEEKNNTLKRNLSPIDDLNENHFKAKKPRLDKGDAYVENEEDYRNYKNRYEMRENKHYHSRSKSPNYRKLNSRGRGRINHDLRSKIELKRINYRDGRSRSREDCIESDKRCNKEHYRNAQNRGHYIENNLLQKDQHYGYNTADSYEYGEQDSGVFNSQINENSYEQIGAEPISPEGGALNTTLFANHFEFKNSDSEYFEAIERSKKNLGKNKATNPVNEKETCSSSDISEFRKEITNETKIDNNSPAGECTEFIINDAWEIVKDKQLTEDKIVLTSKIKNVKPKSEKVKISDVESGTKDVKRTESSKSKNEKLEKGKKIVPETKTEDKQNSQILHREIPASSGTNTSAVSKLRKISETTNITIVSKAQATKTSPINPKNINVAESNNSNISLVYLTENVNNTNPIENKTTKQETKTTKPENKLKQENKSTKQDQSENKTDVPENKQDDTAIKENTLPKKQDFSEVKQDLSEKKDDVSTKKQKKKDTKTIKEDTNKKDVPSKKQDDATVKQDILSSIQGILKIKQDLPEKKDDVSEKKQKKKDTKTIKQDTMQKDVPSKKQDDTTIASIQDILEMKQDHPEKKDISEKKHKKKDTKTIKQDTMQKDVPSKKQNDAKIVRDILEMKQDLPEKNDDVSTKKHKKKDTKTIKQDTMQKDVPSKKQNDATMKQDVLASIQDILEMKQDLPEKNDDISEKKQKKKDTKTIKQDTMQKDVPSKKQDDATVKQDVLASIQDILEIKKDVSEKQKKQDIQDRSVQKEKQDVSDIKKDLPKKKDVVSAEKQNIKTMKQEHPVEKNDVPDKKQDVSEIKKDFSDKTAKEDGVSTKKQDATAVSAKKHDVSESIQNDTTIKQYLPATKQITAHALETTQGVPEANIQLVQIDNETNISKSETVPVCIASNNSPEITNISSPPKNVDNTTNVQYTNDRKPPIRGRRRRCVISII